VSNASIVLVGIGANFPNPGVYAQINFAAGPAGPGAGPRNILVFGNQTASGTATDNTVVYGPDTAIPVQTEQDVINVFGAGGHHHRAFLRIAAVLGATPAVGIYFIAVAPSAGSAAAGTITYTTAATGVGTARVWVGDDFVDTTINSGDSVAMIASNVITSVNGKNRWPVVASSGGSGIVTLTAVNTGPEGNWIPYQAQVINGGVSIGTTVSPTANTNMTGGTTADNITSALATIASTRFYYQVLHDTDSTNVGKLVSQTNTLAQPVTGIRQRAFSGSRDTLANEITAATAQNAARAELESALGSDLTGLEIAANNVAIYALFESSGAQYGPGRDNFSLFPVDSDDQSFWKIIPSRSGSASALTVSQITSALNNGITPLALINHGSALQLVKRVTTRSLNGTLQDYRVRDAHRVSVPDWWTDDAIALTQLQFGGKNLAPDPQPGVTLPENSTSPRLWKTALQSLVRKYEAAGQLQNGSAIIAGMIVQQETLAPDRMSALVPLQVIDIADQFCMLVNQVH
jgi:phage tail sheath gpL-like